MELQTALKSGVKLLERTQQNKTIDKSDGGRALAEYYAFLWHEMREVERSFELNKFDTLVLEFGRDAAKRLISQTRIQNRMRLFLQLAKAAASVENSAKQTM